MNVQQTQSPDRGSAAIRSRRSERSSPSGSGGRLGRSLTVAENEPCGSLAAGQRQGTRGHAVLRPRPGRASVSESPPRREVEAGWWLPSISNRWRFHHTRDRRDPIVGSVVRSIETSIRGCRYLLDDRSRPVSFIGSIFDVDEHGSTHRGSGYAPRS